MGFNTLPGNPWPLSSEQMENGGGGEPYELPIAAADTLGGVKVGSGLTINSETGVLSNSNPTPYSLPTASDTTIGGVKVGDGLAMDDGVLSVSDEGHVYSETEQVIGKWIDDSDIYERTYILDSAVTITSGGIDITSAIDNASDISKFISGRAYMDSNGYSVANDIYIEKSVSGIRAVNALGIVSDYITLQYTKVTEPENNNE